MKYAIKEERVYLGGLEAARKLKKRICTSRKYKYAWLRIDPCIEMPEESDSAPRFSGAKDVVAFLHEAIPFAGRGVEHFMVVCTNTKNSPIAVAVPHRGGRASMGVDVTVVFQAVLLVGSIGFIVAHNHPSQDPVPSSEDVELTRRLKQAAKILGVTFFDHIVLTDRPEKFFFFSGCGDDAKLI